MSNQLTEEDKKEILRVTGATACSNFAIVELGQKYTQEQIWNVAMEAQLNRWEEQGILKEKYKRANRKEIPGIPADVFRNAAKKLK